MCIVLFFYTLNTPSVVYVEYAYYMCAVLICLCFIVCIWLMYLLLCVLSWRCVCVCVFVCLLLRGTANVFSVRCLLCGGTQG